MEGILHSIVSVRNDLHAEIEKLRVWWCGRMHQSVTWPRNGWYRCRQCHRWYEVPWTRPESFPVRVPAEPVYGDLRGYARRGDPLAL